MLYLPNSDVHILQIPHCGTQWLWDALTKGGVEWQRTQPVDHLTGAPRGDVVHRIGEECDPLRTVVFIRHPLTWLLARWNHRVGDNSWHEEQLLPKEAWEGKTSASDMLLAVATKHPGLCGEYMRPYASKSHVICRTESASLDLVRVLRQFGEPHDAASIYLTRPVKATAEAPRVSQEAAQAVVRAEASFIRDFNY